MLRTWKPRQFGNESGQTLVETAFTFSILISFIIALMQTSLAFYSYESISEIARETTRYAIMHGPNCVTSSGVSCQVTATTSSGSYPSVNSYATQLNIPNLAGGKISATTTYPNGELVNQPVSVTVTYTFPYRIPLMASQNLTLSSTSVMYIVQ